MTSWYLFISMPGTTLGIPVHGFQWFHFTKFEKIHGFQIHITLTDVCIHTAEFQSEVLAIFTTFQIEF